MLTLFKKIYTYIKYICICVKQNVSSSVSNKTSFIFQTLMMALNNCTWLIIWLVLFNKNDGNINGIVLKDILYLWSIPTIAYGLSYFCFGGTEYLAQNISQGNLDLYLTQPKYSLIGLITSRCKLSAMGDVVYGLVIGLFATNFNLLDYLFLLLVSIIATITITSIVILVYLTAFWFGDTTNLGTTYINSLLINLTIYPEKVYGSFVKVLIYTVIPAFYCAHLPIKVCTEFSIPTLLFFIGISIFFVVTAVLVYNRGLKRYESGNGFNLK